MADYPYCTVPGKLSEFLAKIQSIGIPEKVTTRWLPTIGFGSTNDRSIITVLKFIGLVDGNGVPTQLWSEFRGQSGGRALEKAVKNAYSELFRTYPDAQNRTTDELQTFIRGHTTYGTQAVSKAVKTFKTLCQHSEFESDESAAKLVETETAESETTTPSSAEKVLPTPRSVSGSPSLHIDIQIHISPEATSDQIEKIFESMAKHLYEKNQ